MDRVWFNVNEVKYSVGPEVDSTVTLLDYLRSSLNLFGTKYMCREGGCGACIVSVAQRPGATLTSVNACLVLILSCQDWEITTIEHLGNRFKGYHDLQKCLAECNGSQCGYCSPSWIMAMYSLLNSNPNMTELKIEKSFASNTCRCTGYRPILDALKMYAQRQTKTSDIMDIEDVQICERSGNKCKSSCKDEDWCFVSRDIEKDTIKHIFLSDNRDWYAAETVKDIFNIFMTKGDRSYMLVAGNTAKGKGYPIDEYPRVLIDVTQVKELKNYLLEQNLVIGAGSTITKFIKICEANCKTDGFQYLSKLIPHLYKIGHYPLRNIATIAGNLVIKNKHHEFPSDIFLLLQMVGAQITIAQSILLKRTITLEDFLKEDLRGQVLLKVLLPPLSKCHQLVTYKVMPRAQNAKAIVNAGFLYNLATTGEVKSAQIAYGGLSPIFTRALMTEKFLVGKTLFTNETLQSAISELMKELVVTEDPSEAPAAYRRQLTISLFYKGLLSLCPSNLISPRNVTGATEIHDCRPVSKGQQVFDTDPSLWPLNQPVTKLEALIQCSGEAKYPEDVPIIPGEVFASFVLSTVPLGTLESIDPSEALVQPGVIAFYSAKDIPGKNSFIPAGDPFFPKDEVLLCKHDINYFNQPIGIIVAETRHIADRAAKLVRATYSNVRRPVLDIRIAKDDPERRTLFITHSASSKGNDVFKRIQGETSIYGQYHYCMETIACITILSETGIKVYPTSQNMDGVQVTTSRALKMLQNSIDVTVLRIGGGFGLKISRSSQVAVACSLVVQKLNRPCRFIQSLSTNMRALGKRLPCNITYKIEVNSKGEIQYLKYSLYEDNGYILNEPYIANGDGVYNNCYRANRWDYTSYNIVTDTASNSWMRAPGTLEVIVMAECLMERIAYEISQDPLEVRLANLDTDNYKDLIEMIDTLKQSSNHENRRAEVEKYNVENRWKKRGLRFALMRWTPLGAPIYEINLSICHDDGSVVIVHNGIEMGQGVNTKAAQVCSYFLKIPLDKINIKENTSIFNPNGSLSGGSQASSNVGLGVQKACEEILERLEPIRLQLGNPTWEELISAAFLQNVDLQAHGFISPKDIQMYNVYGVAVAEVEVDILTGQSEVVRVDLLEDAGLSVNQKVDVGQKSLQEQVFPNCSKVEGAFIMGLGYFTCEKLILDPKTGELLSNRTWNYKVPQARDIPQDFRVSFRKNSYGPSAFLGAKAIGEPPICLAVAVPFAMREAITSARFDSGIASTEWFEIDGPWTVDQIFLAAATKVEDYKF